MDNKIKVALVDDHALFRGCITSVIKDSGYSVHLECNNGKELIAHLNPNDLPDVVLMDNNMPEMDGYETTLWLKYNYPSIVIFDTFEACFRYHSVASRCHLHLFEN
ncbi:MAG: response regulator transcription factor [Flavisolibacter sp.]|nr:response regulator transcription factor [Flavisolibacter sp.]